MPSAQGQGAVLGKLQNARERNPWHFRDDPHALFREHVWINPFWEDCLPQVVEWMGPERVIFGSDWPHMEGLPAPRGILPDVAGLGADARSKILERNTRALTELRPA